MAPLHASPVGCSRPQMCLQHAHRSIGDRELQLDLAWGPVLASSEPLVSLMRHVADNVTPDISVKRSRDQNLLRKNPLPV
jgi:hypothetical protein